MKLFSLLLSASLAAFSTPALATGGAESSVIDAWIETPGMIFQASEVDLEDLRWVARPVVVFADSEANPAFQRQMELFREGMDDLIERDVLLIIDTDPDAKSDVRLKLRPRGFMLTLIGKDGGVKLRKPFPWDVRELSRSIDKTPLRKQELRDSRAGD